MLSTIRSRRQAGECLIIKFTRVRWKNFLSTGDNFIDIDLTSSPSTLIVGRNGSGKSTMLDALSYGLFGKAHRSVNRPQLVNSINQKDMVVEVFFTVGRSHFRVYRGQRPHVFEIYRNDKLVNQASSARDYQTYLEQTVLKLSYKSFHQVVVLGSSSFVPFMQLPTGQRRQIIEDLLDINIFTKMNQILRDKNSSTKEALRTVESAIEVTREKIRIQKKYISDLKSMNEEQIQGKLRIIEKLGTETEILDNKAALVERRVEQGKDEYRRRESSITHKLEAVTDSLRGVKTESKQASKILKFFVENDECPVCTQTVGENLSQEQISLRQSELDSLDDKSVELEAELSGLQERMTQLRAVWDTIEAEANSVSAMRAEVSTTNRQIARLNTEIAELYEKSGDADEAERDLRGYEIDVEQRIVDRQDLKERMNYNSVMFEMLKDTGIKTKIIRKYLPVMNKMINHYLQILDFFVQFTLDENFKEVIKSRHRDEFSYSSFSEGEKQRIDLALLFTWRMIAGMKNSIKTNLLILDETFDSSLDEDGVDNLMKILDTLDAGTNVFVISHKRDLLDTKFPSKLVFSKTNNFSTVAEE